MAKKDNIYMFYTRLGSVIRATGPTPSLALYSAGANYWTVNEIEFYEESYYINYRFDYQKQSWVELNER